jgi:hypothetical protein
VPDSEELVTEVMEALARVRRLLGLKATDLNAQSGFAEAQVEMNVAKTEANEVPEPAPPGIYTEVRVEASVDASIEGARGVAWGMEIVRRGREWDVERDVTFYPNDGEDVRHDLVSVRCTDSRDLVARLPRLVEELLAQPVPV